MKTDVGGPAGKPDELFIDNNGITRPWSDCLAGDRYRDTLIPRANDHHGPAPLWYGWAIMDAFLAGIDYAREQKERP